MAWGLHYFDDKILLDKRLKSCFAYLFCTKITQSTTAITDCFCVILQTKLKSAILSRCEFLLIGKP